ncbi:DUF2490 domain-containing protein [Tunicatimonas pelagia]|uniref:DUF2490 domain-containing protein n=1 Tax=Tunicatimonas pelagia TaxID=931531 RepID=UPI002664EE84|nr:DUF2490 domain-containing protein [Tunicatimonas pelagia]WKN46096.1 DUF2490 domain-containing protein [Tunicatimonas pelagia]
MRLFFFIFIAAISANVYCLAQSSTLLQWKPGLSFTQKFQSRWSLNVNIKQRGTMVEYQDEENQTDFQWNLNETQVFATYELWGNKKLSGGYAFQLRSPESRNFREHRFMEQFAFVIYALAGKRIASWVQLEQRIRDSGFTNRLRYQLGFDSPLNGEQLDPGELYAIVTNEYLWSFNREEVAKIGCLPELAGFSTDSINYKPG